MNDHLDGPTSNSLSPLGVPPEGVLENESTADEHVMDESTDGDEISVTPDQEITDMLEAQETRIGQVYRMSILEHLSAKEIAETLEVDSSGFVSNNVTIIKAITGEEFPTSPSLAKQSRSKINSLLRANREDLSDEAATLLKTRRDRLTAIISEQEIADGNIEPEFAETTVHDINKLEGVSGIYAFSFGWYLENPERRSFGADAVMLKVGQSENIRARMKDHMRKARTVLPEPVVLVRAYGIKPKHNLDVIEKNFHRLLETAGHGNRRMKKVGRQNETGMEWFLTNVDFLDSIADMLDLSTVWSGSSEYEGVEYDQ